jgi:hypothetical protein
LRRIVLFCNVPEIELSSEPLFPPVIEPVTEGAFQLYVVPAGTIPSVISSGEMKK